MKMLAILISTTVALAGCRTVVGGGCPPLATYTAVQQKQAAGELRALPKGSQIGQMVIDYGKMRDACRATGPAR